MRKKILTVILMLATVFAVFASGEWYQGQKISGFNVSGLKNVNVADVNNDLYEFKGKEFSDDLINEIETKLYKLDGVKNLSFGVVADEENGKVKIVIDFEEYYKVSEISFEGNDKVKRATLSGAVKSVEEGDYIDIESSVFKNSLVAEVQDAYISKGFDSTPVDLEYVIDEEEHEVKLVFNIEEGVQSRLVDIEFEGNSKVSTSLLSKKIKSKVKSVFSNGYLNLNTVTSDAQKILTYYQSIGYIDASIDDIVYEEVPNEKGDMRNVKMTFVITEGEKWTFGGITVEGNSIFSDEQINALITLEKGSIVNLQSVQNQLTKIADLYYDNGYISNSMNVNEDRDEKNLVISYVMKIVEGKQAIIEKIIFTGLTKTKEYVMERELEFAVGDVFSKAKLITSAQNLYNTGLLSSLDYDMYYGSSDDRIVIEFIVEEGSQMDIQFGATFGGNVSGFPISGFLQWSDRNLRGRGQELDVNTVLSPDSQSVTVSFGDNWFKNKRWSNQVSLSASHINYEDEKTRATNSDFYNGRNADTAKSDPNKLMDYQLYSFGLGYDTGYTFIYDVGRLSISGGADTSINRAVYDKNAYFPYELLIYKYGKAWQFSNKLSLGIQWDGRDYVTNTTKGYVVGASATYAGGFLFGLSNYIKLNASAAGYLKLFEVGPKDEKKNIMLCASTSASFMLPQFAYNSDTGKFSWQKAREGATKYEMLYIDGMTNGRGFDVHTDFAVLWDNMLEISYPLAENVIQAEAFINGIYAGQNVDSTEDGWYLGAGIGLKLKVSGFPLGFYLVKNATIDSDGTFKKVEGSIFHNNNDPLSGINLVLAISTSLI